MIRRMLMLTLLIAANLATNGVSSAQRQGFIPVEGGSLSARIDEAVRLGRSKQDRFWTAYAFDVRPGVAVDYEYRSRNGTTVVDGASFSIGSKVETRNLGVFVLHEPGDGSLARVEIYNLDRPREYSGYPVYWLGRAPNEESLTYLKSVVEGNQAGDSRKHSIIAIALHDDPRIGGMLEDFIRRSDSTDIRSTAVFWLGQVPGHTGFLAELVRNEQESAKIRKEAAFAIGVSKDPSAMSTLESAYGAINDREVRKQIIFAASVVNNDEDSGARKDDQGTNFLIRVAESDQDRELRKQALFWLGQRAGKRSLEVLGNVVEKSDDDTEVQKQAVFAISQRPKDEAVPLLIKIARTHPKAEVRKQAMFWLGQSGDERALAFFKEVLSK